MPNIGTMSFNQPLILVPGRGAITFFGKAVWVQDGDLLRNGATIAKAAPEHHIALRLHTIHTIQMAHGKYPDSAVGDGI